MGAAGCRTDLCSCCLLVYECILARADLKGVLDKLESSWVRQQYQELLAKQSRSEAERQQLQALGERMAELKGVLRVGVFPPG